MRRGSQADFWRAVEVGRRLARLGWRPRSLSADRPICVIVDGRRVAVRQMLGLYPSREHLSCWIKTTPPGIDPQAVETAAVAFDPPPRFRPPRSSPSSASRSARILALLPWLRRRAAWSACSIDFFRLTRFRVQGLAWELGSGIFFARGEGLYWNNQVMIAGGTPQRRTMAHAPVEAFLRSSGFRLARWELQRGRDILLFDQDFLPTAEIVAKARRLVSLPQVLSQ